MGLSKLSKNEVTLIVISLWGAVLLLSSCGKGFQPQSSALNGTQFKAQYTGSKDPETGKPYTSFSPIHDWEKVSAPIQINQETKDYASTIKEIKILNLATPQDKNLVIGIKFQNQPEWTRFEGLVYETNGKPAAYLRNSQLPATVISATCSSFSCEILNAHIYENENLKTGFILRSEVRTIKLKNTRGVDPKLRDSLDARTKDVVNTLEKGTTVRVESTEIVAGKSSVTIQELNSDNNSIKTNGLNIRTELLDTDGEQIDVQSSGTGDSVKKITLAGNDTQGDLVFRLDTENKELQKIIPLYIEVARAITGTSNLLPPSQNQPTNSSPTPVQPDSPDNSGSSDNSDLAEQLKCKPLDQTNEEHPFVTEIMKDCGHPLVISATNEVWLNPKSENRRINRFLNLYKEAHNSAPQGEAHNFKKMLDVLQQNSFPKVWSTVSLQESDFRATARSHAGAQGFWQFMPATARQYGLRVGGSNDQRNEIVASTTAATKYFRYLLNLWKRTNEQGQTVYNIKMALASYNAGEGNTKRASNRAEQQILSENVQNPKSIDELSEFSEDFWELSRLRMLPSETRKYVPLILGASHIVLNPKYHGVSEEVYFETN